MDVPMDNRREIAIGGKTYTLEASLGTGIIYANEFRGKLDEPYRGILADDMLRVFNRNQPVIEEKVKVDKKGNVVLDKRGMWVADDGGEKRRVKNPDYTGPDMEAVLRIAWAMARAADSTDKGYADFLDEVIHLPSGVVEEARLYNTTIVELGGGITFRRPEGRESAVQPDEAQAAEGERR